jgi:5'(3')-deoxyribonucleotidase
MDIRIAIDIDGVLADFACKLKSVVREKYHYTLENEDIQQLNLKYLLGLNDQEERQIMDAVFADNQNFPPVGKAIESCHRLEDAGYELMIVTARYSVSVTLEWLRLHKLLIVPYFINIDMKNIPDFDYLLDDSPVKIARLAEKTRLQAFLFDTPWNQNCIDLRGRYQRIFNWDHFIKKMRGWHGM